MPIERPHLSDGRPLVRRRIKDLAVASDGVSTGHEHFAIVQGGHHRKVIVTQLRRLHGRPGLCRRVEDLRAGAGCTAIDTPTIHEHAPISEELGGLQVGAGVQAAGRSPRSIHRIVDLGIRQGNGAP